MHCYQWPDKSELPPSSWFGASSSAAHISLYTVYDTAWMNPLPEFPLLLIWRGHFNSMRLCIFWLSCLSSLAYITSVLWIDTLLALDMVNWTFYGFWKGVFFIFHFYSWALNLAVNAFKTDSALLDSWIKTMLPSMTTDCSRWPLMKAWASWFFFSMTLLSVVSSPSPTHRHYVSLVCTWHFTSLERWQKYHQFPHQEEYDGFRYSTSHLNHVILHLNVVIPVVLFKIPSALSCLNRYLCDGLFSFGCCVLFSTHIWLCLTPGEFPLLG